MSYELAKSISINEKTGKITGQFACNNIRPLFYTKSEFYDGKCNFRAVVKKFLSNVDGGCIQPLGSEYKFNYAFHKMKEKHTCNLYYLSNSKTEEDKKELESAVDEFLSFYNENDKEGNFFLVRHDGTIIKPLRAEGCRYYYGYRYYDNLKYNSYKQAYSVARLWGVEVVEKEQCE